MLERHLGHDSGSQGQVEGICTSVWAMSVAVI